MSRTAQDPDRESGPGAVIAWGNMALLAALISALALKVLCIPSERPEFVRQHFAVVPLAMILHIAGATVALAIGPLQLSARLRETSLGRHRWLGRAYLLGVLVGGPTGLMLAARAQGGLAAQTGFAMLAILWMGATAMGYLRIRSGQVAAHRRWMIRSYALTFAAVALRIYLPLSGAAGISFEAAYPAIAWLCWVPNLAVAELINTSSRR
jgi:uncharacterized membrane protein